MLASACPNDKLYKWFSLHPGVFHLRNCSVQFISHNLFLQAVKHIIITLSFRFFDMFFVYNIIETSCFVLEKKITDPFCRPLVLIETPEPPLSFNHPSPHPCYSSLINDRLYKSITTVKLHLDWSSMVYSCVGSADLFFILGCISSNLHCCT